MLTFIQTFIITLLCYTNHHCQAIDCPFQSNCGPCTSDGKCTLNCGVYTNNQCSNSRLTCKDSEDCDIQCTTSYQSVCNSATIDASTANNVAMSCHWTDSCNTANVQCGTGDCTITCNQQNSCQNMVVDAKNANNLLINCWLTNSCNGMDVTCGSGQCYMNCGSSPNGQDHCTGMKLKCGTGDCIINCQDQGYKQCNSITVDTSLAKSFNCIGTAAQCNAAPPAFTAAPTETQTTNAPTTSPTTTASPTNPPTDVPSNSPTDAPTTVTSAPTTITQAPTKTAPVSVEISIIADDVSNITITDIFTEIITDYLTTQLSVNSNFSLNVDVIQNKVIVTISIDDNMIDETQLIAYVDNKLEGTNIKIINSNIETTNINEMVNKIRDNNNGISGGIIAVIVIVIVFVLVLLIAFIFWYRRKREIYGDKSAIRAQLNEIQMNKHLNVETIDGMNNTSIHEDIIGNDDSLDDVHTEPTGSAIIGETNDGNIINDSNSTNTGNIGDNNGYDYDDTDVLNEVNKETKGGNDMNDMIIEDETSGNNPKTSGMFDDDIIIESNIEGEIIYDKDMDIGNMKTIN